MSRHMLTVRYDGASFGGWQIQKNTNSIQAEIERALSIVLSFPIKVTGASRTDAGVHAHNFIAHFDSPILSLSSQIQFQLNGILPHQIRIISIMPVAKSFHARYSALKKRYRYQCWVNQWMCPFYRPFCYHIKNPLCSDQIEEALKLFIGTMDFRSFAHKSNLIEKKHHSHHLSF